MSSTPPLGPEPTDPSGQAEPTGPGGYPQYSAPPEAPAAPAAPVAQPQSIATAVKLMYAGAALSVVGLIVSFATLGSLKDTIEENARQSDPNVSQSTLDAAYSFGIASAVIGAVIGIALWLWMAWKNGQGRSWARIVATVLTVINVLTVLYAIASGNTTTASTIISVISAILGIVILGLLWRKESSEFYAASSAPTQNYR